MAKNTLNTKWKIWPVATIGTAAGIGLGVLLVDDPTGDLLGSSWWVLLILALSFLVLLRHYVVVRRVREDRDEDAERESGSQRRATVVMFVAVPLMISLVGGAAVLPDDLQLLAIRAILLLVVCMLPAILWYLFITTRRASLLNEFLANVDRLGLMREQPGEQEVPRKRRISGYLQRFGAVYGDLPEVVHTSVQENKFKRYTRAHFSGTTGMTTAAVPVLTSTVLISIGWLLTLPPVDVVSPSAAEGAGVVAWIEALTPTLQPITLAFIGAYFFGIQMLFRRYALKDLRGSAYIAVSMRIILAIIGVWVLTVVNGQTTLLNPGMLYMVSFAIGVFPHVIWQIVAYHLKKIRFMTVPSMRSDLPLDDLDGLTVWHQARLEEEDIDNIPNMATADLVDLFLNTRLAPNRIIDWTDQAILYTQLGTDDKETRRGRLHTLGIRNATTFLQVAAEKRGSAAFETLLDDETHTNVVHALESSLRLNSNLQLVQCWRRICEHSIPRNGQDTVMLPVPVTVAARNS